MVVTSSSVSREGPFPRNVLANNYVSFFEIYDVKLKGNLSQVSLCKKIYKILNSTKDANIRDRLEEIVLKHIELNRDEIKDCAIYTINASKAQKEICNEVNKLYKQVKNSKTIKHDNSEETEL